MGRNNPKNGLPSRRDVDLPPRRLTVAATVVASVASAITLPLFDESFSWSRASDGVSPWAADMYSAAFFIGVPSMFLALRAYRRERRRHSKTGRRLALLAILVAIVGTFLWWWSIVAMDRAGLLGL